MAGTSATIEIELVNKVSQELRKINKDFQKSATQINAKLQILKFGFDAVTGVVRTLSGTIADSTRISAENEKAERRLFATLQGNLEQRQEAVKALTDFNAGLQRRLGLADGELKTLQGTLSAMGLQNEQLIIATKATLGLAEATGQGLNEAARTVAKSLQGNVGVLKEYGITVKNVEEAQEVFQQKFDLAIVQAGSFQTQFNFARTAFEDLLDAFGDGITQSSVIGQALGTIGNLIKDLEEDFRVAGKGFLNDLIKAMADGVKIGIEALLALRKTSHDIANEIAADAVFWTNLFRKGVTGAAAESQKALSGFRDEFARQENAQGSLTQTALKVANAMEQISSSSEKAGRGIFKLGEQTKNVAGNIQELVVFPDQTDPIDISNLVESVEVGEGQFQNAALRFVDNFNTAFQGLKTDGIQAAQQALANSFAGMFESIAKGDNIISSLGSFVTDLLKEVGRALIGLGTASVAKGTLSLFFPGIGGGPAEIAAGASAIAVGTGLLAGGLALSGSEAPGNTTSPTTSNFATGRSFTPTGGQAASQVGPSSTAQTVVVNISGPVGGSPRRVANDLQKMLNQGAQLRVGT